LPVSISTNAAAILMLQFLGVMAAEQIPIELQHAGDIRLRNAEAGHRLDLLPVRQRRDRPEA
jgi:hypothetical protein